MGKRGGIRQRQEAMHADGEVSSDEVVARKKGRQQPKLADTPSSSASPSANLPFNASMKRDWCQGRISAKQVQEYAFGAQQQGAVGVIDMAKAGSSGRHPQNIHRSLVSMFGKPDGAPAFCWHDIPTKKGRVLQPFMLPHEWFAALCREKPDLFNATIKGGDDSTCTAFWTCMAETPFMRRHPVLSRDMLSKTIPLGFYGDAGSFSHQDSLYVFTWNSMLGGRSDDVEEVFDHLPQEVGHRPRHTRCYLQGHCLVLQCAPHWHLARSGLEGTADRGWVVLGWWASWLPDPSSWGLGVLHQHLRLPQMERGHQHVLAVPSFFPWPTPIYELR